MQELIFESFLARLLPFLFLSNVNFFERHHELKNLGFIKLHKQLLAEIVPVLINQDFSQVRLNLVSDLFNKLLWSFIYEFLEFFGPLLSKYFIY